MRTTSRLRARAAALATTIGLALGGAVVLTPPAGAAVTETSFGFQATAYGARAVGPAADLTLPRVPFSYIYCTRLAGRTTQNSVEDTIGLPLNDAQPLVKLSSAKSVSRSYRDLKHKIAGAAQGTNSIGSLVIGGIDGGPELSFDGLRTTSTAWVTTDGRLHSKNTVNAAKLNLTLPGGTPIDQPLQDLLDAVGSQVIGQVIAVLGDNLGGIDIPGLGRIYLLDGFDRHGTTKVTAFASSFLIRVHLYGEDTQPGGGDDFELNIGRSWARITKGVRSGVMSGVGVGARETNTGGLRSSGDIAWKQLPCEGTHGTVATRKVPSTKIGSGDQATATGLAGSSYGVQRSRGRALGWTQGRVARFALGGTDLVLEGVVGRTTVRQSATGAITTSFAGSRIDRILVGGKVKARDVTPANASRVRLGAVKGVQKIRFFVRSRWSRGGDITAVKLVLTDPVPLGTTSTADLGFAQTAIKRF